MKKLFLALCIGALSTTSSLIAQVADSTVVDTSSKVAPSRGAPMVPDLPKEAEQPSRGIPIEQEAKEEKEESGSLKLLREERLKREILEGNLEEAIAYPLNLETENLSSFQVLDSIADHNRFIFTGEDHRVEKFNTTLETKMMQYLNTKGYQYYLMEAGWVSAYMVNRYILSGDSAAEQILSTYYSHNFFEMFKGLKLTNDSLAPDKKITAVGLDIERDAPLALRTLLLMLPDKQAPDSLEMFVESLKILSAIHIEQALEYAKNADKSDELYDFGGYSFEYDMEDMEEDDAPKFFYFNMIGTIRDLTQRFRGHEAEFKDYLGDGFADFERVIKEMENWLVWVGYEKAELPQSWVYREQYMEGNFRAMFKDKPEAKGFGQFGRCHITRVTKVGDCGFAFFSSLNKRIITKMPELENQLSSIGIFYGGLDGQNKNGDNGNINDLIRLTDKGTANLFMDLNDYGDELLQTKFSAVIVVKSNRYKEDQTKRREDNIDWQGEDNVSFSFDFNFIQRSIDFGSFNEFSKFNTNKQELLNSYEFGMTVTVNRIVANIAIGYIPKIQNSPRFDSISQTVGGYNFRYTYGKDLLRSKVFELTPELGIGFMRLKYTEERTNVENSLFGTPNYSEFYNPAFLLDGRINFGMIIGIIEIRGFAGYSFDVSKEAWKQGKNLVLDGPKTSFSGVYSGVGISLRFNETF